MVSACRRGNITQKMTNAKIICSQAEGMSYDDEELEQTGYAIHEIVSVYMI